MEDGKNAPPESVGEAFAAMVSNPRPRRDIQQFYVRKPVVVPSVHTITSDVLSIVGLEVERLLLKARTEGLEPKEAEMLQRYVKISESATQQAEAAAKGVLPGVGKGVEDLSDAELKRLLGIGK